MLTSKGYRSFRGNKLAIQIPSQMEPNLRRTGDETSLALFGLTGFSCRGALGRRDNTSPQPVRLGERPWITLQGLSSRTGQWDVLQTVIAQIKVHLYNSSIRFDVQKQEISKLIPF